MKLQPLLAFTCIAILIGMLFTGAPGCIGPKAKVSAQFPPAQLAWPGVKGDYQRGLDDGVDEGDLTIQAAEALRVSGDSLESALATKNLDELRLVPWATIMRPWVDRGITDKLGDGDIGPLVAGELTERADNFTATIISLQGVL